MEEEEFGGENVEVEILEDISPLCEMILELCKKAKSKEEIVRMLPPAPQQLIEAVLAFLCDYDFLKEEKEKYEITEAGKALLELPVVEDEGDYYAN